MFKKVEILDKEKFKGMKFNEISSLEVARNTGVIPLGFNEIIDMAYFCPVLIMGNDDALEFVAFSGISQKITVFNNENIYVPNFLKTYPFMNMMVKDENDNTRSIIGIDNDKDVGKRKKTAIFTKDGELTEQAQEKITSIRELNRQRDISRKIVMAMKEKDLLLEKDFKVKYEDEEKVILEKFYIINREKLTTLDDTTVSLWAKKGWMTIIDCHIKSLMNFEKVLVSIKK
jgi:hypothetical protein